MSRWDSDAFANQEIARQILKDLKTGGLGYLLHPLFGWRARPNVKMTSIQTNEAGLRSRPMSNLSNVKAMLIGGSFSWGYGASTNDFIPSYQLEDKLKAVGKDISIINLAEQMFASPQQIASFVFSVDELKPDYVICVTGYNDTSQGYRNIFKNHPEYQRYDSFIAWGNAGGLISGESNIKKIAKLIYHRNAEFADPYGDNFSFKKPEQKRIPLTLTGNTVKQIEGYCQNNGIKVAFVLEPLVYFKQSKTDNEMMVLEHVGKDKQTYFEESFAVLRKEIWAQGQNKVSCFIDSNEFIADETETVFFDDIHMSDKGYKLWTGKLYQRLEELNFFSK